MANVARQLRQIADRTNQDLTTLVRRVNLQLATSIIIKTPVDDGYLRGGWVAQMGSEPSASPEQIDKSGRIAINGAREVGGQLKLGGEFWFVNALPYAKTIEDGGYPQPGTEKTVNGYSRQAPQGMVKLSVREIQGIVRREASKL